MAIERPIRPAKPPDIHWKRIWRTFRENGYALEMFSILREKGSIRVRSHPKLFPRDKRGSIGGINSGLRRSGLPYRIIAEPPGQEVPFERKTIHLYEIAVTGDESEVTDRQDAPSPGA